MLRNWCLLLSLAAVSSAKAFGTDEDLKAFIESTRPAIRECSTIHGIGEAEFKAAQKENSMDTLNPCFLRCFLGKPGIINDEGYFDIEKKLDIVKTVLKKEEDIANYYPIERKCIAVNDRPVTDGAAGCERAKMLITCELEIEVNRYLLGIMGI